MLLRVPGATNTTRCYFFCAVYTTRCYLRPCLVCCCACLVPRTPHVAFCLVPRTPPFATSNLACCVGVARAWCYEHHTLLFVRCSEHILLLQATLSQIRDVKLFRCRRRRLAVHACALRTGLKCSLCDSWRLTLHLVAYICLGCAQSKPSSIGIAHERGFGSRAGNGQAVGSQVPSVASKAKHDSMQSVSITLRSFLPADARQQISRSSLAPLGEFRRCLTSSRRRLKPNDAAPMQVARWCS